MQKNKQKKYSLFFRMPKDILTPFYVELLTRAGYGYFTFFSENKSIYTEWYLSDPDKIEKSKEGYLLYSNKKQIRDLIRDGKKLSREIEKFLLKNKPDIELCPDDELKKLFVKTSSYFVKFGYIYSFTEDFYTDSVSKKIYEYFISAYKNSETANHVLSALLKATPNQKIIKGIKIPKKIRTICENTVLVGKAKFLLRPALNDLWDILDKLIGIIAKRNKLNHGLAKQLFFQELIMLFGTPAPKIILGLKKEAKERIKGFIAVKDDAGVYIFESGKKAILTARKNRARRNEKVIELKGDIANFGIARGRVIKLEIAINEAERKKLANKIKKMNKGDILVAQATGTEMTAAFQKAGAIVCEWGGITSHAAVISREMNIPGVINTKVAMKALEDDDWVEVDALKGVVRILKKR
jgi:phosphohistidine swiveling domain-containing protein